MMTLYRIIILFAAERKPKKVWNSWYVGHPTGFDVVGFRGGL
jgi:hypothetical protein